MKNKTNCDWNQKKIKNWAVTSLIIHWFIWKDLAVNVPETDKVGQLYIFATSVRIAEHIGTQNDRPTFK